MSDKLWGRGRTAALGLLTALAAAVGLAVSGGAVGDLHATGARGGIGAGTGPDLVNIYCSGYEAAGFGVCISNNIASPPRPANFDPNGH